MVMSNAEIVAEYRQAKTPMKQIGILADQNQCSKKEIVKILLEAGETVPQNFLSKPPAPAAAPAAGEPEADYPPVLPAPKAASAAAELRAGRIARAAVDAIARLLNDYDEFYDDGSGNDFTEQVRGVLALTHELMKEET